MAYVPTNWATGDVITAEKLNKIENGIVDANSQTYPVNITIDGENMTFTCDKTWNEIKTAYENGKHVIMRDRYTYGVYYLWEIINVKIASETGAVEELQFSRCEITPNRVSQSFLIINETARTISERVYSPS